MAGDRGREADDARPYGGVALPSGRSGIDACADVRPVPLGNVPAHTGRAVFGYYGALAHVGVHELPPVLQEETFNSVIKGKTEFLIKINNKIPTILILTIN